MSNKVEHTMVEIKVESILDIRDEIVPLTEKHWEEIALYKDKITLDVDYGTYETIEASGNFKLFTARVEGKLVGYFGVVIKAHPHYSGHLFACNDVIYIDPDYRLSGLAKEMIAFAEEALKDLGVSVLTINTKDHSPFDKLLLKSGFDLNDRVYGKYLGGTR